MVQTIGHCAFKNSEEFLGELRGGSNGDFFSEVSPTTQRPTPQTSETKKSSSKGYQQNFTVGTSVVKILEKNPNRVSALVRHTSTGSLYLGFDQSVSSTNGLLLNQYDSYEINQLNNYTGEIWAIASASSQDVRIIEF